MSFSNAKWNKVFTQCNAKSNVLRVISLKAHVHSNAQWNEIVNKKQRTCPATQQVHNLYFANKY